MSLESLFISTTVIVPDHRSLRKYSSCEIGHRWTGDEGGRIINQRKERDSRSAIPRRKPKKFTQTRNYRGTSSSSKNAASSIESTQVLIYNKPKGLLTTHNDELGRETVYDRLRDVFLAKEKEMRKPKAQHSVSMTRKSGSNLWHAIGRLDAPTTGLLLFTNNGSLVHHVTNSHSKSRIRESSFCIPEYDQNESDSVDITAKTLGIISIPKTYRVLAKGLLSEETIEELRKGVELSGGLGMSGSAGVEVVDYGITTTILDVCIDEGKNRQIRRMFLAVGSQVIRLARTSVGGIGLDGLSENQSRWLSQREIREGLFWKMDKATIVRDIK